MSRHHPHQPDRYEQLQITNDEALAARLQAEQNSGSRGHQDQGRWPPQQGPPQNSQAPQNQYGPPAQGYQSGPPPGYQNYGPSAGPPPLGFHNPSPLPPSLQGFPRPPPQNYQSAPPQNHPSGPPQNYQSPPPQGYQSPPPQNYQNGPPQNHQNGPPQGYQSPPPQQGPNPYHQGPQPEFKGSSQYQVQTHYQGGAPTAQQPQNAAQLLRRKSLLIGINYTGSKNPLRGCHQDVTNVMDFLRFKGYASDPRSQVILRDDNRTDPRGPFFPTYKNIVSAMQWLVSEPNTCNFLHFSGHGSQVKDPDGDRDSGYDCTIVPLDWESAGQLDSDKLHRILISALPASSTLFIIFDCCHSGSAVELPFVYRSDADGNVSMMDNVKTGLQLLSEAKNLIGGGFSMGKVVQAKQLFAGASTFLKQMQSSGKPQEEGVGEEHFVEDWKSEHKFATMFSGCRDDQTSADASIAGSNVGAMSWAFLETMKRNPNPTYLNTLQQTRKLLGESNYKQVPQLSIGFKELDLNQPLRF